MHAETSANKEPATNNTTITINSGLISPLTRSASHHHQEEDTNNNKMNNTSNSSSDNNDNRKKTPLVYGHTFRRFDFDDTLSVKFVGKTHSVWKIGLLFVCLSLPMLPLTFFCYVGPAILFAFLFLLTRWSVRFRVWATTKDAPLATAPMILVVNSFDQREIVGVRKLAYNSSQLGPVSSLFEGIREQDPELNDDDSKIVLENHSTANPVKSGDVLSALQDQSSPLINLSETDAVGAGAPFREDQLRVLDYKCNRFILNVLTGRFVSIFDFRLIPLGGMPAVLSGVRPAGYLDRQRLLFGLNMIDIQGKSWYGMLFEDVLHPFNVFQVACISLWTYQKYITYVFALSGLTIISVLTTLYETVSNVRKMREMARFVCPVTVWREGRWQDDVPSDELVPGDLVRLDIASSSSTTASEGNGGPGAAGSGDVSGTAAGVGYTRLEVLPCDGIMLNGDALIDECMLTGETIPIAKSALESADADDFERISWGYLPGSDQQQSAPQVQSQQQAKQQQQQGGQTKSVLFAGTRIIRARHADGRPPIMVVTTTGFQTAKGALVKSIMFPRPNNFRFYRDLLIFIGILVSAATFGFAYAIFKMSRLRFNFAKIAERSLDLFTITVPPAIHTVMSIGTIFAMKRLKQDHRIFCISPPRINVASRLNLICFDKTGTLTEDGLDVKTVIQADEGILKNSSSGSVSPSSAAAQSNPDSAALIDNAVISSGNAFGTHSLIVGDMREVETFPSLVEVMAGCHSIQVVNDELIGDPLDLKMFEWTGWHMEEAVECAEGLAPTVVHPPPSAATSPLGKTDSIAIIRWFDFVSSLRRMSVVCQLLDKPSSLSVLCKGSPESLKEICRPETIPANYMETLALYARQGLRVIGCAGKRLLPPRSNNAAVPGGNGELTWSGVQKLARKQVESELDFYGFIVFENKLKPHTTDVIQELHGANIWTVMSTGDNVMTAVCVGRECGMIVGGGNQHGGKKPAASQSSIVPKAGDIPVFLPRLLDPQSHLPTSIAWECPDRPDLEMDPVTWVVTKASSLSRRSIPNTSVGDYALACTGDILEHVYTNLGDAYTHALLLRCRIFARMSPAQKAVLVELLQRLLGYSVGFVGDGANDCGALKAADVGLSLSPAEASVAAPFTSKVAHVSSILAVIREGRTSLTSSFALLKYMALYSMIQLWSMILLFTYANTLSNGQFSYIDIMLVLPLSVFLTRFPTGDYLTRVPPTAKLLSFPVLLSLLGQSVLQLTAQAIASYLSVAIGDAFQYPPVDPDFIQARQDYDPEDASAIPVYDPHEPPGVPMGTPFTNTVHNQYIFLTSCFLYLTTALVFSQGHPHRKRFYGPFFAWSAFLLVLWALLWAVPDSWWAAFRELLPLGLRSGAFFGNRYDEWVQPSIFFTPFRFANLPGVSHQQAVQAEATMLKQILFIGAGHAVAAFLCEFGLFPLIISVKRQLAGQWGEDEDTHATTTAAFAAKKALTQSA